ncbi:hypothetical protein OF83DRAFT_631537 [Amylostereum chailletii]|nr:hypothetical protein OF83DRAFT_631537 [Amylostereum chailletii]
MFWTRGGEILEDTTEEIWQTVAKSCSLISVGPDPHCECSLVAFLHRTQIVIVPYIGGSIPPCPAFDSYVRAYNDALNRRAGHSKPQSATDATFQVGSLLPLVNLICM